MFIIYFYGQFSIAMLVYWMINMMILPIKHGDFPVRYVSLLEGMPHFQTQRQFDSVRHPSKRPRLVRATHHGTAVVIPLGASFKTQVVSPENSELL